METLAIVFKIRKISKEAFQVAKIYDSISDTRTGYKGDDLFEMLNDIDAEASERKKHLYKAMKCMNTQIYELRKEFSLLIEQSEDNWLSKSQYEKLDKISPIFEISEPGYILK